jgi:HK97 gp10 family phage protein
MAATTVRGVSAVVRNLQSLNKDIEAGARKATMRAAMEIEREAVSRVPVDTGRLKGSIMTQEVGDVLEVGSGVKAGSEVDYAHTVEFGSSRQAAHPYLQPAVEIVKHNYPGMMIEDVKAEIR